MLGTGQCAEVWILWQAAWACMWRNAWTRDGCKIGMSAVTFEMHRKVQPHGSAKTVAAFGGARTLGERGVPMVDP